METLVTLGIFVMVVVALSDIYMLFTRAQQQTLTGGKFVADASALLDEIARQVRTREIVFFGTFDYDGPGTEPTANTQLYVKDGDGGPSLPASFIVGSEIELALQDSAGGQLVYLFNPAGATPPNGQFNFCTNPGLPNPNPNGLYAYSGTGGAATNCSLLFDLPNVEVEGVKFYVAPAYNPYPDSEEDCKLGTSLDTTFNGYYCQAAGSGDCPSTTPFADGRCRVPNQQPRVTIVLKIRDTRNPTESITLQTTVSSRVYKR